MMINLSVTAPKQWAIQKVDGYGRILVMGIMALGLTAAASILSTPIFITVTGVLLVSLAFFISQKVAIPPTPLAEITAPITLKDCFDCPTCEMECLPGASSCPGCGRELSPLPPQITSMSTPASFRQAHTSYYHITAVIIMLILTLLLGWQ